MTAPLALLLACLLPSASARAEVDVGETVAEMDAHTSPQLKKIDQEMVREVKRREQRRREEGIPPGAKVYEPLGEDALESMLSRVPGGPPFLTDLRREAAEERGQMVEQNIQAVGEKKTAADMKEFVMQYLRDVYYRGNNSTEVGPFLKKVLETPKGWALMPYNRFGPLPPPIAGLYDGSITLKYASMVVYSHELLHHLGNGEPGAYGKMGKEFGGNGISSGSGGGGSDGDDSGEGGDYSFQCPS